MSLVKFRSFVRSRTAIFLAAVVISLGYAAYTNHTWEDWYITFRASKNLANGDGLTFTKGERVYSFTSPLGTLVPALCSGVVGNDEDGMALWLYRIISATMLGLGVANLAEVARALRLNRWSMMLLCGSLVVESKTIDHTISGMETGFMVFFLSFAFRASLLPSRRPWLNLGCAWGGLMWTRPDGFVYGAAIAIGMLLFRPARHLGNTSAEVLRNYVRAASLAAVIYLPWFAGTWIYYGSPIPHTIVAKSLASAHQYNPLVLLGELLVLPFTSSLVPNAFDQVLVPSYAKVFGGWPSGLFSYSQYASVLACFYWLNPFGSRLARCASLAAMLAAYYLTSVVPTASPWYLPNLAVLLFVGFGAVSQDAFRGILRLRRVTTAWQTRAASWMLVCVIALHLLAQATLLGASAIQSRWQQVLIEDGVRMKIGRWLADRAKSRADTVMLECLGYIGFFSNLKMLDYPGMGSPEMVQARRKLQDELGIPYASWGGLTPEQRAALIRELRPDWLVFRPAVARNLHLYDQRILTQEYFQVEAFSARDRVDAVEFLPGREFLHLDDTFFVFSRNPYTTSSP